MGVVFDLVGKLVVKNEGKVGDIDSAGSDVGGDEELDPLFLEGTHHFVAFLLSEVALEDFNLEALFTKLISKSDGAGLGPAKDESSFFALFFEEIDNELVFLGVLEDNVFVVNVAVDDVLVLDFEERCFGGQVVLDEVFYLLGEGGGEEPSAFALGGEFEDFGELGLEAHAEHFVGFVENEETDRRDVDGLAFEKVE